MTAKSKLRHIAEELRSHAPFTLLGAVLGIVFMLIFRNIGEISSHRLFAFFHPVHVVLSAMVTASMFKKHATKKWFVTVLLVGFFGSVGVATVSDIIIPHIGVNILGLDIPAHTELHHQAQGIAEEPAGHEHQADKNEEHKIHLGFIEEWYLVIPAALLGIVIAYFLPRTKFPHAGHVLVSTWASSAYLLMNMHTEMTVAAGAGIFVTLFLSIWLPCCVSDIIFPLLFVGADAEISYNNSGKNAEKTGQ